jgi:hypothetical protein
LLAKNSYQGFGSEYETLLNAFDKDIASLKKRVGKDRVASMLELAPEFIKDFAAYLSTDRGLANGTIWQRCSTLRIPSMAQPRKSSEGECKRKKKRGPKL